MKNAILFIGFLAAVILSVSAASVATQVRFSQGDIYKVRSDKNYLSQTECVKRSIVPSATSNVYEKLEIHERYTKSGLFFNVKSDTVKVETFYEN